jgi:hypothetical protein
MMVEGLDHYENVRETADFQGISENLSVQSRRKKNRGFGGDLSHSLLDDVCRRVSQLCLILCKLIEDEWSK